MSWEFALTLVVVVPIVLFFIAYERRGYRQGKEANRRLLENSGERAVVTRSPNHRR